ncbi:MAG: PKD domain-containing protein [Methanolobus sp.]
MYIDLGLTITGSEYTYTSAKVYIGEGYVNGQDYLRYSTTGSITGSFSTSTGILTLSGSGNAAAYQAAFRNVRYENTNQEPNTADRKITFVLGGNSLYSEDTGHYYEYVSYTSSWANAKANADTKTMEGMQGYLATITSEEENNFLMQKIQADAWIGASDAASEGYWRWVTGPEGTEDEGAGRLFYLGTGTSGTVINGEYNKWNGPTWGGGEPNNAGDEDAGQMYSSNNGTWNDLPHTSTTLSGYLLEYGGMSGDATPQLSTTVTVSVTSVNDVPTTPGAFTSPTNSQVKQGGSSLTVGWGTSSDAEGDSIKYNLWFFNGTWSLIGNLLSTNSMAFTLPEDNTDSAMFRVYANDTQDNSSARDVTFTIDSLEPEVIYGTNGNSSYSNSHSTTVFGTDTIAGIAEMAYAWTQDSDVESVSSWNGFVNGSTLTKNSADGDWYLHVKATDNANNINYSVSGVFKLDNTDPVINIATNSNSTYSQNQSTVVTATDVLSGMQELEYAWTQDSDVESVSSWTSFENNSTLTKDNADGDWYLHIKATDNASNVNQSVSGVFKLDNSAPAYSWISKPLNANTGETVLIVLNVTDLSSVTLYNANVDGEEHQMNASSGNYSWTIEIPASNSGELVSQISYNCTFSDLAGNVNNTGDILLNVSILPIADFSANVTRGYVPLEVAFQDNSSGLFENWLWDFGDGSNSTEQNPIHTFDQGNFTVNLTVTNGNGTSTHLENIRAAFEPEYTILPNETEQISIHGDELNFSIQSTLISSFEWLIDEAPASGSGITMEANTNDSDNISHCLINTSQYINQSEFFVETYNVSVAVSNESTGMTDTFSWEWTVTNSSTEDSEDIFFVVEKEANLTVNGSQTFVEFNTTDDIRTDDNNVTGSIVGVSFYTSGNATELKLKIEVINKSSINESEIDFLIDSAYQYLDISFNNATLANELGATRNIEFRVLNEMNGGSLEITSVRLRHYNSNEWETYIPELLDDDGTYSYYIVRNVSGFSPFAITASYTFPSTDDGMPIYLKELLMGKIVTTDTSADEEQAVGEKEPLIIPIKGELSNEQTNAGSASIDADSRIKDDISESNYSNLMVSGGILLIAILLLVMFLRKRTEE